MQNLQGRVGLDVDACSVNLILKQPWIDILGILWVFCDECHYSWLPLVLSSLFHPVVVIRSLSSQSILSTWISLRLYLISSLYLKKHQKNNHHHAHHAHWTVFVSQLKSVRFLIVDGWHFMWDVWQQGWWQILMYLQTLRHRLSVCCWL